MHIRDERHGSREALRDFPALQFFTAFERCVTFPRGKGDSAVLHQFTPTVFLIRLKSRVTV